MQGQRRLLQKKRHWTENILELEKLEPQVESTYPLKNKLHFFCSCWLFFIDDNQWAVDQSYSY